MEAAQVEELTSGASGRIIPVFKNLRRSVISYDAVRRGLILIKSLFLWIILLVLPRRHRSPPSSPSSAADSASDEWLMKKRKFRKDEEDALRRRALAEALQMVAADTGAGAGASTGMDKEFEKETGNGNSRCLWSTSLFYGVRRNALFCRSWLPVSGELKKHAVLSELGLCLLGLILLILLITIMICSKVLLPPFHKDTPVSLFTQIKKRS